MDSGAGPTAMTDSLRGLLTACCTLHRIARFYGTRERMTTLLSKVTNQLMRACRQFILAPGNLWDQPRLQLIANMQVCYSACRCLPGLHHQPA